MTYIWIGIIVFIFLGMGWAAIRDYDWTGKREKERQALIDSIIAKGKTHQYLMPHEEDIWNDYLTDNRY